MSGSRPDDPSAFDRTEVFRPAGAPAPATNLPRIPGITLHHEIARGGMGVVYSGRQDFLDRRVAVKLLSIDLVGEKFAQRFQREAKLLAGIKHQNIVACYEAGTTEQGQSYLVMEFVDGPNLKSWVAEQGPLPIAAALRLTKAVAQALGHAYQLGVIHRDVKPENILLESVTSTAIDVAFPFTPKLVDLGLARMTSEGAGLGLTSPGAVMGTPSTMSPEQFDDPDSVDFRTDVYGLGCALYEMLVGAPAFRGNKLTEIVVKKREPVGPDPCAEAPRVPREVGALVSSMLSANRDHRPSSYKELDERLDALLASSAGEPSRPALRASTPPPGSRIATTVPPAPPAGSSPPPSQSGPGLLRTAELDFLQEGIARGGTMPAFRDSSTPPAPPAATAPARSRRGLAFGSVGVLAIAGVGVWFATREVGDDVTRDPPVASPNRPPRIDAIEGPDRIDLAEWVTLRVRAGDDDGDELSYRWSAADADEIGFGEQRGDSVRVRAMDGLPGEAFEVRVAVDDGKGEPTVATKSLVVGESGFVARRLLAGFESDPRWRFDPPKVGTMWTKILDRDAVSCRAGSGLLAASTSMGDEAFWQLEGRLESKSSEDDPTRYADTAVRIACDDRAWSLVCTCAGDFGERWSIELRAEQRLAGTWERQLGAAEAQRVEWLQDEDSDVTPFAEFTVTRRRDTLVLRWGQGERRATTEVQVPDGVEPELVLWVEHGIGRFVDFTLR